MEKEPGITIEMVRSGYSNMRVSQKDVDEILGKYPDLNGIMTTSAVTALGLSEATEGREISIVSVDAQEDALKAVQDGRIVALGAQSGYQIGYETIRYIVKDLEGEGTGEDEILDSQVLTEENIDIYMKDDRHLIPDTSRFPSKNKTQNIKIGQKKDVEISESEKLGTDLTVR